MTELWKDIPGYEGSYQVSDLGRVKSLDRTIESPGSKRGYPKEVKSQALLPQKHSAGYLHVRLQGKTSLIQELVMRAFVGQRPIGLQICHNDGNRHNNALTNLRFDTPKN